MDYISKISDFQYADIETILEMKNQKISFLLNSIIIYFKYEYDGMWQWLNDRESFTELLNNQFDRVNEFINSELNSTEFLLKYEYSETGFDIVCGNKFTNNLFIRELDPDLLG